MSTQPVTKKPSRGTCRLKDPVAKVVNRHSGKINIEYIHDAMKRTNTFHKRKKGLFKKGQELHILTGKRVAVRVGDAIWDSGKGTGNSNNSTSVQFSALFEHEESIDGNTKKGTEPVGTTSNELGVHMQEEQILAFVCGFCYQAFSSVTKYYSHLLKHEDFSANVHVPSCIQNAENEGEFFSCGICNISFPSVCSLYEHLTEVENMADFLFKHKTAFVHDDTRFFCVCKSVNETQDSESNFVEEKEVDTSSEVEYDVSNNVNSGCKLISVDNEIVAKKESVVTEDSFEEKDPSSCSGLKFDVGETAVLEKASIESSVVDEEVIYEENVLTETINQENHFEYTAIKTDVSDYDGTEDIQDELETERLFQLDTKNDVDCICDQNDVTDEDVMKYVPLTTKTNTEPKDRPIKLSGKNRSKENNAIDMSKRKFVCDICQKCFYKNSILKRHMQIVHGGKKYECDICLKTFPSRYRMTVHRRSMHLDPKPVALDGSCEICNKVMKLTSLEAHVLTHSERIRKFPCGICTKTFYTTADMNKHRKIHGVRLKEFICETCNHSCRNASLLNAHRVIHQPDVPCHLCPAKFKSKGILKSHLKTHSETSNAEPERVEDSSGKESDTKENLDNIKHERNFTCDICGKAFYKRSILQSHKTRIHGGRTYECDICLKTYSSKYGRDFHRKRMHTDPEPSKPKPQGSCSVCSKVMKVTSLEAHMLIHTERIRQFSCDICAKTFYSNTDVKSHKKICHVESRNFICEKCGASFKRLQNLQCHRIIHKPEPDIPCHLCPAKFKSKAALICHSTTHSDERPFSCEKCGKTFKTGWHLSRHLWSHKEEKTFKCSFCDKIFKFKEDVKKHEKIHMPHQNFCDVCGKSFAFLYNLRAHEKLHVN